jgi:hypothetical protein
VAHTYILATQEAEIRRMEVRHQPGQIVLKTLSQKNPSQKKAGGVAQDVGTKFKPQHCKKKKRKRESFCLYLHHWGWNPALHARQALNHRATFPSPKCFYTGCVVNVDDCTYYWVTAWFQGSGKDEWKSVRKQLQVVGDLGWESANRGPRPILPTTRF